MNNPPPRLGRTLTKPYSLFWSLLLPCSVFFAGVESFCAPRQQNAFPPLQRQPASLAKSLRDGVHNNAKASALTFAQPSFVAAAETKLGMSNGGELAQTLQTNIQHMQSLETALVATSFLTIALAVGYVAHSVLVRNKRQSATMTQQTVACGTSDDSNKSKGNFWYPNVESDPAFAEPLPDGDLGCPFFGNVDAFWGSRDFGTGDFYLRQSRSLDNPKLWKYYFVGTPVVVIAGSKALTDMLQSEFRSDGVLTAGATSKKRLKESGDARMLGPESMISEGNKGRHSQLRRLVGQALTPSAITKSLPRLQAAAKEQIEELLQQQRRDTNKPTPLEDYCTGFTLDVACRQILGLDLTPDEIPTFRNAVLDWITGQSNIQAVTGRGVEYTKGYKARILLEDRVRRRIRDLEANGPDGTSTLSAMLFAEDDGEDDVVERHTTTATKKKLTKNEVVDNAMLLILAGSETASTTMTNALLCMALNPRVWTKLVEEQRQLELAFGTDLTREVLDKSVYLESVVKETMRIRPAPTGLPRRAMATRVVDGKQIPKGWVYDWSILLTHEQDPVTFQEDGSHMDLRKGFQPERWENPESTPVEYMPLGAGPRFCLGATLAMTEMKVFLATFARQVDDYALADASAVDNLRWRPLSIMPKEENGVLVRVTPREQLADSTPTWGDQVVSREDAG